MATIRRRVTPADTAAAVGSGDLPVLGTPVVVAWCEAATVAEAADGLVEGETTVGTRVEVDHVRASGVDAEVEVTARRTGRDGRRLTFEVTATQDGTVVAEGTVHRVVVDAQRFLERAGISPR